MLKTMLKTMSKATFKTTLPLQPATGRSRRSKALGGLLLGLVLSLLLSQAAWAGYQERLDRALQTLAQSGHFSGVVLLARDHKIVYQFAIGDKDKEQHKPLTIDSCFNLASISKPLLATLFLKFKEAGKVNFDQEISRYFPELPYQGVTIRHLLSHTGGVPEYFDLAYDHWDSDKQMSNADVLKVLAQHGRKLDFAPGSKYRYSNSGYVLLALIAEKITAKTLPELFQQNIFGPLGMHHTFVGNPVSLAQHSDCRVYSYTQEKGRYTRDLDPAMEYIYGDGSVYSTVGDLFQFDQALYGNKLISAASRKEAFTAIKIKGKSTDYGLGWEVGKYSVYHGGSWAGFQNELTRYIQTGDTIIILTNIDNHNNDTVEDLIYAELDKMD